MRHTEPLFGSIVFSASLIGSRELISSLGGDPEAIARAARVPDYAFDAPDLYIDAERLVDFLEISAQACNCPQFGLLHGSRLPMGIFGQVWLLMRDAASVRAALECFVRYYGYVTDMGAFQFERDHGGIWLHYNLRPLGQYGNRQVINASLAVVCMFVRENIQSTWNPRGVRLAQPGVNNNAFSEFFGRKPEFNAVSNAIFIEDRILDRALGAGDFRSLSRQLALMYSKAEGPLVLSEVKSVAAAEQ